MLNGECFQNVYNLKNKEKTLGVLLHKHGQTMVVFQLAHFVCADLQ